jgi:hypothetical protein
MGICCCLLDPQTNVRTDKRLLRRIEGYLMELVCNVKSIDE